MVLAVESPAAMRALLQGAEGAGLPTHEVQSDTADWSNCMCESIRRLAYSHSYSYRNDACGEDL